MEIRASGQLTIRRIAASFTTSMDEPYWLDKTRGYIDLEMFVEALRELDNLPPDKRDSPEACEMRIIIQLDQNDLERALALSRSLSQARPENHAGFIQGAFCLHAMGNTNEAIDHLQSGPETLLDEPVYFYNLACYEAALGKTQTALTWLRQSVELDKTYRAKALTDPDLILIHDDI
jgi:predicted Zn-dependent protease